MRTLKTLIAVCLIALPMLSSAADTAREPRFEFAGTVDRIDTDNNVIIIGDMLFRISPSMTVIDTRQRPVDRKKLKLGMKVGINTYQSEAGRYVHEMQILPSNANLEELMDD
ncbi:MAG TPA: hypothetical protein ENJ80_09125 [Gammaproteobacteria bacterium]|nr:hypothetical protein [Gammaproteobacteria bacterium]